MKNLLLVIGNFIPKARQESLLSLFRTRIRHLATCLLFSIIVQPYAGETTYERSFYYTKLDIHRADKLQSYF